jgi:hypothetical protein
MTITEVKLSELPRDIQNKIPYSIRSKKDIYELNQLPFNIQYYINDYYEKQHSVEYGVVFDTTPYQSNVEDFETITNYYDLIVEYLKNYLIISKGQYPFDPLFYSRLKKYVQTKDTSLQYTLINDEINRIINILTSDLNGVSVKLKKFEIDKSNPTGSSITYNVLIRVEINNTPKSLTISL